MNDQDIFRWILGAGCLLLFPFGFYHRWKSQTGEKLDRRQEGWFILITLRLLGVCGMLGLLAFLFRPQWIEWAAVPLPLTLRWSGVGLAMVTGLLYFWTFRSLGKNLTDTVVTRKDHTLVTTGPYRWIRHPFYVAGMLLVLGTSLISANAFIFVTGSAALCLLVIRTRKEEQNLIARFGDNYRNYMQRTGRFFPRL